MWHTRPNVLQNPNYEPKNEASADYHAEWTVG